MRRYLWFLCFGLFLSPITLVVSAAFLARHADFHLPQGFDIAGSIFRLAWKQTTSRSLLDAADFWTSISIYFAPTNIFVLPIAATIVQQRRRALLWLMLIGGLEGYIGAYYLRKLLAMAPLYPVNARDDMLAAALAGAFSGIMFGLAVMAIRYWTNRKQKIQR
jgi:hypothetical protein